MPKTIDAVRKPVMKSVTVAEPRRFGIPARLSAVLLVLVISLLLSEIIIRVLAPQPPSWLDIYRRHPVLDTYTLIPNLSSVVDTGENRWEVHTDGSGLRDSGIADDGSRPSVLCLGDSFTFGQGVDYPDTFVGRLDESQALNLQFLNAAVPGYGPIQYRMLLEFHLRQGMRPRFALIGVYMGNDFHDCLWKSDQPSDRAVGEPRADLRDSIKRNSHLYRLMSRAYHRLTPTEGQVFEFREAMYLRDNWKSGLLKKLHDRFELEFRRIADLCKAHEIPLFVVLIPTREGVDAYRALGSSESGALRDARIPIQLAAEAMQRLGIDALDVTPALAVEETSATYFAHDGHFTPLGHRLVAEAIQQQLNTSKDRRE